MPRAEPPRLRPARLDTDAVAYANRLADDWQATGLVVSLDRLPRHTGYVLTARSPSRTLRCECRRWSRRGALLSRRRVWTIAVAVGRDNGDSGVAGVAGAEAHEEAWRQVLAWIDGRGRLGRDLAAAVGDSPKAHPGRLAAAVIAMFAAGFGAGLLFFLVSAWW